MTKPISFEEAKIILEIGIQVLEEAFLVKYEDLDEDSVDGIIQQLMAEKQGLGFNKISRKLVPH